MALHTNLPIYKVAYDLVGVAVDYARNMPRDVKHVIGDRLRLAKVVLRRGHAVDSKLTKAYKGAKQ